MEGRTDVTVLTRKTIRGEKKRNLARTPQLTSINRVVHDVAGKGKEERERK